MAFNEQPSNPNLDAEAAAEGISARQLIDEANRHFALKEYSASSDKLAQALEQLNTIYSEDADELAPVLHLYGRSLLENFIVNSAALGGGGGSAPLPAPTTPVPIASGSSSKAGGSSTGAAASKSDPRFSFTGDAEDDDDDQEEEAPNAGADGDEEDDLQVAFSVLDLSRVIYHRMLKSDTTKLTTLQGDEWNKTRLQAELAEVMNLLGDVGLESENFTQASADYKVSLELLEPLLNPHSRRLGEAHLRLGLALEYHPDVEQRKGAQVHVQAASDVLAARVAAIQGRIINPSSSDTVDKAEVKEEKDDLANLTDKAALEKELKDIQEMKKELDTKLEEYETEDGQAQLYGLPDLTGVLGLPAEAGKGMSTKDALQQAIKDAFLGAQAEEAGEANPFTGASKSAIAADAPVNNLSGMVKRKKKAEGDEAEEESKKAKTEA
ncbi:uncharacterized protein MEPE_02946 [Melanopsichium pennsylvanicum]|uniref:Tetratricopeptide SHNi-TPR domain-containing protein n=2 Tax=Melanopsichium pennsylvanicum TaxID=63383 RepID=A0AAJ5C561_9BASI|nr:potential histone binding protein [Melanopsichium pennsylvanicum 4]SNX84238.1 uncharacterized protein MEPE_02946 [Melanopsichium pennsylvanicum]